MLTFDSASNAFAVTHLSSSGWLRDGVNATETLMAPQSAVLVHAGSNVGLEAQPMASEPAHV